MGINDEYSRDAYLSEDVGPDGPDEDAPDSPLHPEDWQDWYSEKLMDTWMSLRAIAEANYMDHSVLSRAQYTQWVEFVMNPQEWGLGRDVRPSGIVPDLWRAVCHADILSEATFEQFQNFVLFYS
jgi:hypothetical protein